MNENDNQQIIQLKEQIDDLKEYLYSDACRSCGEIALRLESYIQKLENLLNNQS